MAQRAPLVVRIGVIVSSLLLVTGFIGYRTGYLFSDVRLTSGSSNADSIELTPASTPIDPLESDSQQSLQAALGTGIHADATSFNAPPTASVNVTDVVPDRGFKVRELMMFPADQLDALRRRPGKASPVLMEHDAMQNFLTLSSSSKSIVLLPQTPADRTQVVDDYKARASAAFSKRDQDGDGKLTASELGEYNWSHFEKMGAVENGVVDSEGFLKNYFWYLKQK